MSKIKKINEKEVELKQLTNYIIPTNVTKLNDYCFAYCSELTEIKGLEQIKEFGIDCLTYKIQLDIDKLHLDKDCFYFNGGNKLKELVLPELLKEIEWIWLHNCYNLEEIEIKGLETIIPMKCFEKFHDLTNITIPLNETRVVCGNKIFNNQSHFNQSIYLPIINI